MAPDTVVTDRLPPEIVPDLEWVETTTGHELRGAEKVYAELRFESGKSATFDSIDAHWEIRREGWFKHRLLVRNEGRDAILATMDLEADEGILVNPADGSEVTKLRWSSCGTWDTEEDWVIRYHNTSGPMTHQARVEVDRRIADLPELLLLITLGWFLEVLRIND